MALNITGHARVFKITKDKKEIELPDPNPHMSLEEVQKFYAGKYPEINNANLNGPKVVGGKAEYSFKTSVGTKG